MSEKIKYDGCKCECHYEWDFLDGPAEWCSICIENHPNPEGCA